MLKRNWKLIVTIILGLPLPMLVLNFGMDIPLFDSFSNADDSAWLGFWGGYLGAVISIGGLYWQTNKQLQNESKNRKSDIERQKDQYYNEARALFSIIDKKGVNFNDVDKNYVSKQFENLEKRVTNWLDIDKYIYVIQIHNFSDNPMLLVKINLFDKSDSSNNFCINRINRDENAVLLSTYSIQPFKKKSDNEKNCDTNNNCITKIELFYTTNKGEQIFTEFVKNKNGEFKTKNRINQYQAGGGSTPLYTMDNFSESKIHHIPS